jgi:hypothetical protein
MTIVVAHDAIHVNVPHLPPGQACGYTTGSPDIKWEPADWAAHPGAVRIDQDVTASDGTADVLDVERGAATPADCPGWAKRAQASYAAKARTGQRAPAIYTSESNITTVVNALIAGGVHSGVYLWGADWSIGAGGAADDVLKGNGPFPVIGMQYSSGTYYDTDVFSSAWLSQTAVPAPPPPPMLSQGATGPWVRVLQSKLNSHGAKPPLAVDGIFGPATEAAVREFQKTHGLAVDGIVGPSTWKALGE